MMNRCNGLAPQSNRATSTRTAAFRSLEDPRIAQNYPSTAYASDGSEMDRRELLMRMTAGASVLAWGSAMSVAQAPVRPAPPSVPKATVPSGIAFSQVSPSCSHCELVRCARDNRAQPTARRQDARINFLFLCSVRQVIKGCWQLSGSHKGDEATDRTTGRPAMNDLGTFFNSGEAKI